MGCIATKLDWVVIDSCSRCLSLRTACIIIGAFAIAIWIGIILFFILDEGMGFYHGVLTRQAKVYITVLLFEAAVRIAVSTMLIVGAVLKHVPLLTIYLVIWILLVILVLADLAFSIAISKLDGATTVFNLAYCAGRFLFCILALVIVNSYRVKLAAENKERENRRKSMMRNVPSLVL